MILVLCGTQKQSFTRMIKEVEKLANDHEVIVQAGHSEYHSDKMEIFDFISREMLKVLYERAAYIMTHGGAGSIFQGIKAGKKTIVFPRLAKYGEHVDDHQLQLAGKLEKLGYLLVFNEGDEMMDVFDKAKAFVAIPYGLKGDIPLRIDEQLQKIFGISF